MSFFQLKTLGSNLEKIPDVAAPINLFFLFLANSSPGVAFQLFCALY